MSRSSFARRALWLSAAGVLVATTALASLKVASGSLSFQAAGPAGLAIEGEGASPTLREEGDDYVFEARVDGLKTGIELRDNHLKKYIQADKFPTAKLVVKKAAVALPEDGKAVESSAPAQLTFHGQTKPVTVPFKVTRAGSQLTAQARIEFDLPTFGVEPPCYLGVCVDKHVKVKAKMTLAQ